MKVRKGHLMTCDGSLLTSTLRNTAHSRRPIGTMAGYFAVAGIVDCRLSMLGGDVVRHGRNPLDRIGFRLSPISSERRTLSGSASGELSTWKVGTHWSLERAMAGFGVALACLLQWACSSLQCIGTFSLFLTKSTTQHRSYATRRTHQSTIWHVSTD